MGDDDSGVEDGNGDGSDLEASAAVAGVPGTSPMLLPSPGLQEHLSGTHLENLSPSWRMFLLGDGSPTRHLHILTGHKTSIELIDMSTIGNRTASADGLRTPSQCR